MKVLFPLILLIIVSILISSHSKMNSRPYNFVSLVERTAIGFVYIAYIFLFLGLFHILYWWTFATTLGLVSVLSFVIKFPSQVRTKDFLKIFLSLKAKENIVLLCITFIIFTPALINAFGPVVGYDATSYHLAIPYYYTNFLHSLDLEYLLPNNGLLPGLYGLNAFLLLFKEPRASSILTVLFSAISFLYLTKKTGKYIIPILLYLFLLSNLSYETYSQPGNDFALVFFTLILIGSYFDNKWKNLEQGQYLQTTLLIGFLPVIKIFALPLCFLLIFLLYRHNLGLPRKAKVLGLSFALFPAFFFLFLNTLTFSNPLHPSFSSFFPDKYVLPSVISELGNVKASFFVAIKSLTSNPYLFSQASMQFIFQLITIFIFGVFFLVHLLMKHKSKNEKSNQDFLMSLLIIFIIEFVFIGNYLRYYMYLLIPFYGFLFHLGHNSNGNNLTDSGVLRKSITQNSLMKIIGLMLTILVVVSFTYSSYFNLKIENRSDSQIDTISKYISSSDVICLLGDHRSFLFLPNRVLVFPTNENRNPFYTREIFKLEEIESVIWKRCDIFILKENWGFPPETSIVIIEAFKKQNRPIFARDGWYIYKKDSK